MADIPWTKEEDAILVKGWKDGDSASLIAARLHMRSRNAVIGRRVRIGLPNRGQDNGQAARKQKNRKPVTITGKRILTPQKTLASEPRWKPPALPGFAPLGLPFLELQPDSCRWPLGGIHDPVTHFCGLPKVEGRPYCEFHCGKAYNGLSTRRPSLPMRIAA